MGGSHLAYPQLLNNLAIDVFTLGLAGLVGSGRTAMLTIGLAF